MAITTAQRAPILADGTPVLAGTHIELTGGVSVITVNGESYLVGQSAGPFTVSVTRDGRTGALEGVVTAAPLTITLGTPEPK